MERAAALQRFEAVQYLPISRDEAWRCFSDPRNLAKITPPSMRFVITSDAPPVIHPGLIIAYHVRPLFSIEVDWITEIAHVVEALTVRG